MKPHPKRRKTIKWGGAAVTVLLVVVWVGSGWRNVRHFGTRWIIAVDPGVVLTTIAPPQQSGLSGMSGWFVGTRWSKTPWTWWFAFKSDPQIGPYEVRIPLWFLLLVFAVPAGTAWHLDTLAHRRERAHLCRKCNYDRNGLAAGAVCPECGAAAEGV